VTKNSAAKLATDKTSHRSIPQTCNMELEVTIVDLIRRGLNLMLLSEITNPLFYTSFIFAHILVLTPISNLHFLNKDRLTTVKNTTL